MASHIHSNLSLEKWPYQGIASSDRDLNMVTKETPGTETDV